MHGVIEETLGEDIPQLTTVLIGRQGDKVETQKVDIRRLSRSPGANINSVMLGE
jgi:hypothetical protein